MVNSIDRNYIEIILDYWVITDNPVIQYNFNVVPVDGVDHLLLDVSDIEFVVEEYEEVPDAPKENSSNLILPDKKIIV